MVFHEYANPLMFRICDSLVCEMTEATGFNVDLDDPEDVARKHHIADEKVDKITADLIRAALLMPELEKWKARRDFLASQLRTAAVEDVTRKPPEPGGLVELARALEGHDHERDDASEGSGTSVGNLVVPVVETADGPIRSLRVHEILAGVGHPVSTTMVSNALNYAARAGKIKKVEGLRGYYAPLNWEPNPNINLAKLFGEAS